MWQLVLNLPARGQKHLAQQKCVLETELERNVPWAILGLGNYGFLLPGLQPGSPAFWSALNWEEGEDKNWCEFRVRAKDELIRSGPLRNAELISTSVRTHLWHGPSSAQCISWRVLLLPYCEVWCEAEQLLLSLFLMWIFILMGVSAYTVFCMQLMMSALGGEREGWWWKTPGVLILVSLLDHVIRVAGYPLALWIFNPWCDGWPCEDIPRWCNLGNPVRKVTVIL